MSPLLVTGLLCVACVLASPLDTWTQASTPTKHAAQVSIVSHPPSNIHHHQRVESWCCAVSGSGIRILSCILMMSTKKRTDRTKYWSIFLTTKKLLSLNLWLGPSVIKLLQEYTLGLGLQFTWLSIKVHKINCSQNHIWQPKAGGKDILSRGYVPTYGNDAPMVFSPEVWHLYFAPNHRASGLTSPLDGSILVVKSPENYMGFWLD